MYTRKLTKTWNQRSFHLTIPPAIIRKLGLRAGDSLDIDFEGEKIIIRRVSVDDNSKN